jgi:hypothetical protein
MMKRALLPILACVLVSCSRPVQSAAPGTVPVAAARSETADTTVFLLDGTEIRRGDVAKIDRAKIATVRHLVGPAAHAYRAGAREIVELVTRDTLDVSEFAAQPLVLLDGREVPPRLARVLDPAKIASIDVVKGDAARSYGERGNAGIIVITTKVGL